MMTDHPDQQPITTWTNTANQSPTDKSDSPDQTNTTEPETPDQADPTEPDTPEEDATTDTDEPRAKTNTTTQTTPAESAATSKTDTPFDFTLDDLPTTADHALTDDAVTALVTGTPSPPLADQLTTLATQPPEPTSASDRMARVCYILARAQTGALPGYSLHDSMIPLRDHLKAELKISFEGAVAHDILTAKRVRGHDKYYRLTDSARANLRETDHPNPGVLDDTLPILRDGPIHNRAVLDGATWLHTTQPVTRVEKPHLDTTPPVDLAAYNDSTRTWLGEVVAAEDDLNAVSDRLAMLRDTDANVLLVVENSQVAVNIFDTLDTNDVLDIPPDITYHNFSVAQFSNRLLPDLDNPPFDHLESLNTLNQ